MGYDPILGGEIMAGGMPPKKRLTKKPVTKKTTTKKPVTKKTTTKKPVKKSSCGCK